MERTQHREVTTVQGRKRRFAETFDDRQHRRVHESDVGVGVAINQVLDAILVERTQILDPKNTATNISNQADHRAGTKVATHKVVDLGEDWAGKDQGLCRRFEKRSAGRMRLSAAVHCGEENPGVNDQCH